jgi:hypothetical protein
MMCFSSAAFSQTGMADTLFVQRGIQNAIGLYTTSIGIESHLYNGVLYKEYNRHNTDVGIPFFLNDEFVDGKVLYGGELYEHIPLLLDVTREKLVTENPHTGAKLELVSEKIGYFNIGAHHFVRMVWDSTDLTLPTGFYDVLFDGNVKAYAKFQKIARESIIDREVVTSFEETNRYYIYKGGKYHSVKSKGSVLAVLSDRKSELRKFIHKNKIKFRPNRAMAIQKICAFYDLPVSQP